MLLAVGIGLFVCWLLVVFIFKITKGIIHLALIIALAAIIWHFLKVPR